MLVSLHVKNLALIEETEVEFGRGLNILTGETGAGKSILIGSINLALGARFDKDMLRQGAERALVELMFSCSPEDTVLREKLQELEIPLEEDTVMISRRMQPGKSVLRINGETVSARQVKEVAELLIDIHGQHEHQSLLHRKKHMEILDAYAGQGAQEMLASVAERFREVRRLEREIEENRLDQDSLARERDLLAFEHQEIAEAHLMPGEDAALEENYRRMVNSQKITQALGEAELYTGDEEGGAGNTLSRALRCMHSIAEYDKQLEQLAQQLTQIDDLLNDYNRDVALYRDELIWDEEDFRQTEERLNLLNRLKDKYGNTLEKVLQACEDKGKRLEKLADYDLYMQKLEKQLAEAEAALEQACGEMTRIRRDSAAKLTEVLTQALQGLNFLAVKLQIQVRDGQSVSAKGWDEVEFLISTNPGEAVKPLSQVASGGELSRIMLAIKTVLASQDDIDTLIFDEIDAGISGKTAWKVSEQLDSVAHTHQVICITHLPQIAAMADRHYAIEKTAREDSTVTDIRLLQDDENLQELGRLLGSDGMTDAVLGNAREMRQQALSHKTGSAD
ncbi:MAG: DNA repair protein RecN [bacterium]|nr:DNA repair protein RecN [bacterium]MCM1376011.1 DNA repair protein RecN [Muribaculum sp.]